MIVPLLITVLCLGVGIADVIRDRRARRVPSPVRVAQIRSILRDAEPGAEIMIAPAGVRSLSVEMIKEIGVADGHDLLRTTTAWMMGRTRTVLVFRTSPRESDAVDAAVARTHVGDAAAAVPGEREREHPLMVRLRSAAPDGHGVLTVDLSDHPDLDAPAVRDIVAACGWEVASGDGELLYLCRAPTPARSDPMAAPVPPPPRRLPPGVQARYNWGTLVLFAGITVSVWFAVFDVGDVRMRGAILTVGVLGAIALFRWAGVVRRRRERAAR